MLENSEEGDKPRVVFLGTALFALESLKALLENSQLALIVTQPDRRAARGQHLKYSAVKKFALENNLEKQLRQPAKLKEDQALIAEIKALEPDLLVTCAYGQILDLQILELARWGVWNVHASLLPVWRGAAPIPWSILSGEQETGITIMQTDLGLDTGNILYQAKTRLLAGETTQTLEQKLSILGAKALIKAIDLKLAGKLISQKQEHAKSTYARKITSELARVNFRTDSALEIERKVRAFTGRQEKVFFLAKDHQLPVKIIQVEAQVSENIREEKKYSAGEIIEVTSAGILIATGASLDRLLLKKVQLPNKKAIEAYAWYNGERKNLSSFF